LNALVQFVGYENWQSFSQKNTPTSKNNHKTTAREEKKIFISSKRKFLLGCVVVLILATSFLLNNYFSHPPIEPKEGIEKSFAFISKMIVSEGVPNSVIFNYDATAAAPEDTIYIQQSWDKRLREQVSRQAKVHRSIYYYPGFFQAKLVVNEEVVKEHPLFIKTNGWLPLIEQEESPVYFSISDALNEDGVLQLPIEKIKTSNIPLQPKTPWVSYYNTREFEGLKTDDVIFEAEVKNDYQEGAAACRHTEIHILFKGGALVFPLSVPGCVSSLILYDAKGKIDDTEGLGCDISNWVNLRFTGKNKKGQLYINGQLAYDDFSMDFHSLDIIGIRFRFQGTVSVNSLKLSKGSGEIVYVENFVHQSELY
jgi:hypothetical protein